MQPFTPPLAGRYPVRDNPSIPLKKNGEHPPMAGRTRARATATSAVQRAPTAPHADATSVQIAVRFEPSVVARLEALARKLSRPGLPLSRADALRVALMTGLEQIEHEAER